MRESDIRPRDLFETYLRLSAKDAKMFFGDASGFHHRPCPGCGDDRFEAPFEKQGFTFGRCGACGTLYANPVPSADALGRFYSEAPSQTYWAKTFFPAVREARREMIFRPRVLAIREQAREQGVDVAGGRVVDVGAGAGIFLQECKAAGFGASFGAIEPTPELADACAAAGFDVFRGLSDRACKEAVWANKADLVTSFEVIEHTVAPADFLAGLGKLVRPGGLLVVTGVCGTGFDILTLGARSNSVSPPHHLTFLSRQGAAAAAERAGLTLAAFRTPGRLDVDIVRSALKDDDRAVTDPFLRHLLKTGSEDTLAALQTLIADHQLSSHMWLVLRRS